MAVEEAKKVEVEAATKDTAEEKAIVDAEATRGSSERDAYLTKIMSEKRLTLINAWDEYEKARAENRAAKNLSFITSWEHTKEAELEAGLKKMEEQLEKKKALYKEKLKKKAAALHKSVEKMIAKVEAERGGKIVLVEERAAKYRAKTEAQMKFFGILEA